MSLTDNENGITYGTVMFFIIIMIGIFVWAIGGIVMDELEGVVNTMYDDISPSLMGRVVEISDAYSYLPFMILSAAVVYLIVRGLRRDDSAIR